MVQGIFATSASQTGVWPWEAAAAAFGTFAQWEEARRQMVSDGVRLQEGRCLEARRGGCVEADQGKG